MSSQKNKPNELMSNKISARGATAIYHNDSLLEVQEEENKITLMLKQ